ncbi:MAG: ATP-binding protein, partial [Bacteroidota bacterium]
TAQLMRMVLDASEESYIYLKNEIALLNKYLRLEKLRFDEACSFDIMLDPKIEAEYTRVPPMLIQPFVENALKHGFYSHQGVKKLTVEYRLLSKDEIMCIITDNGIGREKAADFSSQKEHISRGTHLTKTRLSLLRRHKEKGIHVRYEDLKDDSGQASGTQVSIRIPAQQI